MDHPAKPDASTVTVQPHGVARQLALAAVVLCALLLVPTFASAGADGGPALYLFGGLGTAVVVALSWWASRAMKISVTRAGCPAMVSVSAPFFRAGFPLLEVTDVDVAEDSGQNPGLINWPVLGRATSQAGTRLNVGGSAHVALSVGTDRRYTVITRDLEQARELAALLTR
ncbi:hypothetical protein [Galactobacter caseinivorans]|uniref:Bacterial Pleckstrin homology domain-containing protein n=1 Tax=Galactobacter caseinivorans TaxID=2676123 RepID=A0A496PMZ1_9MICC|nr:hypothetical protein [Galactobacter caseinivorans]RKW71826.1 hypothetical protein DWQ67_03070 [Galactobacter caseinivorans]